MSLRTLVVKMIAVADNITKPFQPTITLYRYQSQSQYGAESYASPLTLEAIVDQTITEHRTKAGKVLPVKAYVAVLSPITPEGTAGRIEPVDPRDKIVLPDGSTGDIVDTGGFVDKGTGRPFFSEIWIGSGVQREASDA